MEITTKSATETAQFGQKLAIALTEWGSGERARVIGLSGELGSGKTTLVGGIAQGLGITDRILSPTFIIVRQYECSGDFPKIFYHMDLYQLDPNGGNTEFGIDEILTDPLALVCIEWIERFPQLSEYVDISIALTQQSESVHTISVNSRSTQSIILEV